jgi:hypothetical protein
MSAYRAIAEVLGAFGAGNDIALPTVGGISSANSLLKNLSPSEADTLAGAIRDAFAGRNVEAACALRDLAESVAERYADTDGEEFLDFERSKHERAQAEQHAIETSGCER